jgi:hypothetical protein
MAGTSLIEPGHDEMGIFCLDRTTSATCARAVAAGLGD